MKLIGIDYGSKRVGVSVGDTEYSMAFPRVVLENNKNLLWMVANICATERAEVIILGESKDYKGQNNKIMKKILAFKKSIEKETRLRVILEPEYMTSAEAEQLQGKSPMLDASAAALILKSYMDKNKLKFKDKK
jgi:putative Holliday junction resolvase